MMTAADYLQLAGIAYNTPIQPGAAPVHAAGACQVHAILETNIKFQAAIQEFNLYLNIQLLIKNQILEAIPSHYLEILEDSEDEYNNITIEQMMTHLTTTYRSVSNANLAENLKNWTATGIKKPNSSQYSVTTAKYNFCNRQQSHLRQNSPRKSDSNNTQC